MRDTCDSFGRSVGAAWQVTVHTGKGTGDIIDLRQVWLVADRCVTGDSAQVRVQGPEK